MLQDFVIPKSKNAKAGTFKCFCPYAVFSQTFLVLAAVYFNNKLFFQTYEVKYVVSKRVLSSKFQAIKLTAS